MATYLSPAVYTREIDLSALPGGNSGIIPAFVGTAKKGPINDPQFISNAQQFIDTFGEPFAESFLGYAVLAYLEEGNLAYVNRVGIECEEGQVDDLQEICIDTSGNKENGWGRIPIFRNIDSGKICTRKAGDNGFSFHDSSTTFIEYNDAIVDDDTYGPTAATLTFTGSNYTAPIDDEFLVLITSTPDATGGSMIDGAGYKIIRSSDGTEVASGELVESTTIGTSEDIVVSDGIVIQIVVSSGILDVNDSFRFSVEPDNRTFAFDVWCNTGSDLGPTTDPTTVNTYQLTGDYATVEDLADAINAISGVSSEGYFAIEQDDGTMCFRTDTAGCAIQLVGSEAFALEVGQSLYAFDIPKSNLIGTEPELFDITSSNNTAKFLVETSTGKVDFTATIPTGLDIPAATIASAINASATVSGDRLVVAYPFVIPGGDTVLVVETTQSHELDQLSLEANGSSISSLRFAQTVGILFPYTENYRGFSDSRELLPEGGEVTEETPLSCEQFADGDTSKAAQCQADSAYYENIVGWFVATSAGTWINGYELDLKLFDGEESQPNRYSLQLIDNQDVLLYRLDNFDFDPSSSRYIGDLINPGTSGGGVSGNEFINWIQRPDFLGGSADNYEERNPSVFFNREFDGQANGIPADPIYSGELDRAVIGNPAFNTGIYAFADPEQYDISLMLTPGYSSGSVITTGISVCTSRTDCLYIIDSPFGLNASQVVDWHNGLLFTDLQAALDSSYGALYYPWIKIFDQFNGGEIFTPPSGHVAGVFARTDRDAESWFAPAGLRRGRLVQALAVEYEVSRGERDLLYGLNNAVNSIVKFPQRGIHVWGQRTLQRRDSALDRVNVRMLLTAIKKGLSGPSGILNEFIFEQNDSITRAQVTSSVNNFMQDIFSRRGVTGWRTICDDTNNTPTRIDRNELHVALLIKPTRVAEFVVLNLAILRTDQSFSSEEVLATVGINA